MPPRVYVPWVYYTQHASQAVCTEAKSASYSPKESGNNEAKSASHSPMINVHNEAKSASLTP